MTWVLEGFNTDSRYRDDIRHREYTTSDRKAELFNQIPKIQFTDSGHGIVFHARQHSGPRLPAISMDYVREQMRVLTEAQRKPRRPSAKARMQELEAALEQIERLPSRWHPIAGHQFDDDPREIARAALGREVAA